eukprot:TRINITY_DN38046_c0_g1_i1.p1 TRINITY_DN38046_c0_g1~~TRINITY_DN38046_c0_g1_i1.p1  ORF type:complete len:221 (+),score=34.40 TRINITY_DN38046_c0_g1_i1:100-762(+)
MPAIHGIATASTHCAGRSCGNGFFPTLLAAAADHGHAVDQHRVADLAAHGAGSSHMFRAGEAQGHHEAHAATFLDRGHVMSEGDFAAFLASRPIKSLHTSAATRLLPGGLMDRQRQAQMLAAFSMEGCLVTTSTALLCRMACKFTKQKSDAGEVETRAETEDQVARHEAPGVPAERLVSEVDVLRRQTQDPFATVLASDKETAYGNATDLHETESDVEID